MSQGRAPSFDNRAIYSKGRARSEEGPPAFNTDRAVRFGEVAPFFVDPGGMVARRARADHFTDAHLSKGLHGATHRSVDELARNDESLDLACALIDTRHACVAIHALDRILARVAISAMQLDDTIDDAAAGLARE